MFEQSRIMWHFSDLENRAGLSKFEIQQVLQVINAGRLMSDTIAFAKMASDMKAGAVHLAVNIAKLAIEEKAPLEFRATVLKLLNVAKFEVDNYAATNAFAHSILRNLVEEVELKAMDQFLDFRDDDGFEKAENKESDIRQTDDGAISEVFMSQMPSSERSVLTDQFSYQSYIIRYYENPITIGDTLNLPNVFKFPQVAVVTQDGVPVCMIRVEESMFGTSMIGVLFPNGWQVTYGHFAKSDKGLFLKKVIQILQDIELKG